MYQFRTVQATAQTLGEAQSRLETDLDVLVVDMSLLSRSVLVLLRDDALIDRLEAYRWVVLVVDLQQEFLIQQNLIKVLI